MRNVKITDALYHLLLCCSPKRLTRFEGCRSS